MTESKPLKTIDLALQGGGAHGAFTWGVIDQLLADGRLGIEGISATSAGTMNACAVAYGMHMGGREGGRKALHDFWSAINRAGARYSPVRRMPWDTQTGWNMDNALTYAAFETVTRVMSPYQFNPFDFNPLRDVLAEAVDFDELRKCTRVKLFVSATNVRTGRVKVFDAPRISLDVAMASACLPFLFKAVEIDGEHYWDGGYMGNPSLHPLYFRTNTRDILIVHINPVERPDVPVTAPDINNRINEISFNGSLLKELRSVAFVKKLLEHDMLKPEYRAEFKDVLIHSVRTEGIMCDLSVASKFDSDWSFLTELRDRGRQAMAGWLEANFEAVGKRDTVDLRHELLESVDELIGRARGGEVETAGTYAL